MLKPRALYPGARVALVAGAGPLAPEAVARAIDRVRACGWEPVPGEHVKKRHGYLAGTDTERLADLTGAIESREIEGIWFLRGGYGSMRLLPRLRLSSLRRRPRPLIGFSDNSALLLACLREGVVGFHGPHPAVTELSDFSLERLRQVVEVPEAPGTLSRPTAGEIPQTIVPGICEGRLVGGNLSLVAALMGTPYQPNTSGAIVFLEEIGEPGYRIDRLLTQLILGGIFERAAGVIIGSITETPAEPEGTPTPAAIVRERLGSLEVPVVAGMPFGHIAHGWTLPLGIRAKMDADAGTLALLEPAVS
jgi:muramoyltetrapeptide carboxypeptidase